MTLDFPADLATRPFDVLAIGGLCLEQAVCLPHWPIWNHRRIPILDLKVVPGGSAPNVAVFTARAGGRAAFIGKVGDDERGRELLEVLRREGVTITYCHLIKDRPTTFQIVLTVGDDWSALLWADPALDFVSDDVPAEAMRLSRFLHLDGYGMFTNQQKATVERAVDLAREAGTLVSVDAGTQMAVEQPNYLRRIMTQADIAFANLTEACHITGYVEESKIAKALETIGPSIVVLKLGRRGCLVITRSQVFRVPAFSVQVVDTVGAGDGLVAGMLTGLCRGESFDAAARRGAAVGALVCTGAGSLGSHFGEPEIERLLAEGETLGTER